MSLLFTCRDVSGRLTDLEEGALPWATRLRVRAHLALCAGCRAFRASLRALPGLVRPALAPIPDPAPARAALAGALARLGRPRTRVPAAIQEALDAGTADPLLRVQARVHQWLREPGPSPEAPYLPADVLEALPPPSAWPWWRLGLGGARMARLLTSPDGRHELLLLALPEGRRFPAHRHGGAESLLVLQGGLDDGARHADRGTWLHYAAGHPPHAPRAEGGACWALILADADAVHLEGWRGLAQTLLQKL